MDDLEGFLMEDDMDMAMLQDLCQTNSTTSHDMNLNLDEFWGVELPDISGFESEIFSTTEDGEFALLHDMPMCFTNNEQHNSLPDQYIQMQQQEQVEQTQGQGQELLQQCPSLDDEEDEESEDKNRHDSKNLVSERNRRKRLNQQLFTLRSLVPNITKMDKRSILVDALAYLQGITQKIEMEMKNSNLSMDSTASSSSSCNESFLVQQNEVQAVETIPYEQQCAALPALSEVEVDTLDEERFILRIGCNKAVGALGQVHRVIELLGLEITCISMYELNQENMQNTTFLRVKKRGAITPEKILHRLRLNAKQLGLLLADK